MPPGVRLHTIGELLDRRVGTSLTRLSLLRHEDEVVPCSDEVVVREHTGEVAPRGGCVRDAESISPVNSDAGVGERAASDAARSAGPIRRHPAHVHALRPAELVGQRYAPHPSCCQAAEEFVCTHAHKVGQAHAIQSVDATPPDSNPVERPLEVSSAHPLTTEARVPPFRNRERPPRQLGWKGYTTRHPDMVPRLRRCFCVSPQGSTMRRLVAEAPKPTVMHPFTPTR